MARIFHFNHGAFCKLPVYTRSAKLRHMSTTAVNPPTVHILGVGSIGLLCAHSIASVPSQNVTLLFHRPSLLPSFEAANNAVTLSRNKIKTSVSNIDTEIIAPTANTPIRNLIITTKAHHTVAALSPIRHRLNASSTVLLLQNGMGTLETIQKELFSSGETPKLLQAVNTHGVNIPESKHPFSIVHAGLGELTMNAEEASAPQNSGSCTTQETSPLITALLASPALSARLVPARQFLEQQLIKLAVNSVINPLTAIYGCRNGELLDDLSSASSVCDDHIAFTNSNLVYEAVLVFTRLPEVLADPELSKIGFWDWVERIKEEVGRVLRLTRENVSSMAQDVRSGRETEIEAINGWFVRKGKELGTRGLRAHLSVIERVDVELSRNVESLRPRTAREVRSHRQQFPPEQFPWR